MNKGTQAFLIIIIYCIGLIVTSAIAKQVQEKRTKVGGAEGFLLAGRSFGLTLVTVTTIGFAIGANTTTGVAQAAYKYGFSGGWYAYAFTVGLASTAILFAKKFRSSGIRTISQTYGDYYGEDTRIIASAGQIFMNFTLMVAQFIGGGSILSTLLPEYFSFNTGMIVSAIIFTFICLAGGMMSAGLTNLINIGFIYSSVFLTAFLAVRQVGGWGNMVAGLPEPEAYLSPIGNFGWGGIIAYLILFVVNIPTSQSAVQMIFSAKDEKVAYTGYFLGGILLIPIGLCSAIIGMVAKVMYPSLENTATALPMVAASFPGILSGILLAGMWAAIISTATTMILGNSMLLINDIIKPLKETEMEPKREVFLSRLIAVIFCAITLFFAVYIRGILTFVTMGLAISVGYFMTLMLSWYFPKYCRKSTGTALIGTSLVTSAIWYLVPWFSTFLPHVLYLHLITCTFVFICTLLFDKRPPFFLTSDYEEKFGVPFKYL